MAILGLHHVTATVNGAQEDLDFCTSVLGLRLVKKTVNFDNRQVYHFYYGTERGAPGTIWTTFPYKGHGVRVGTTGAGQVGVTSFSVPSGSMEFWRQRLRTIGVQVTDESLRFGEKAITFLDPSGLTFELIANSTDTRDPWTKSSILPTAAVRGLHSVTLQVRVPGPTIAFMTTVLGFLISHETEGMSRLYAGADRPGHRIDVAHSDALPGAVNGLGTVHHVAMAVATGDEQQQIREQLIGLGVQVTPVMDRQYFTSIYFREPGGVLFEIATLPPGFTFDETLEGLGRDLKLPPWEEVNRSAIEAGLPKIRS